MMLSPSKIRVVVIAGIRSQYIKLCAFQTMLKSLDSGLLSNFDFIYIDAGQHYSYDLAQGYIDDLRIIFSYALNYKSKKPIDILGDMIKKLYRILDELNTNQKVDYVIVFGDANTTMAGAIAASKSGIPLIHVEAGLRLGSLSSAEEGNRIIADHLSSFRFISNKSDYENLDHEGLATNSFFSGDIIYDLVLNLKSKIKENVIIRQLGNEIEYDRQDFVIASMHRTENLAKNVLIPLVDVLSEICHSVLFIAHPKTLEQLDYLNYDREKIMVANHIPYLDMLSAMSKCKYIITDSGAIQRESYYLQKRCLIRQDKAFWHTLVDMGAHKLIGETYKEMKDGINWIEAQIVNDTDYPVLNNFGNGHAVEHILKKIVEVSEHYEVK